MTTAERLKAEGRVEEAVRRTREILLMQLRERFAEGVTAEVEVKVSKAELPQLEDWVRRFAKADSLGEVFAD